MTGDAFLDILAWVLVFLGASVFVGMMLGRILGHSTREADDDESG